MIGFIGDVHGRFSDLNRLLSMPGVDAWMQVGDLGGEGMVYPKFPGNFWFIKGNHENWEALRTMPEAPMGPYMHNGVVYDIPVASSVRVVRVAVLGGNRSPKYTYMPRRKIPESRARHFIMEEVDSLLADTGTVDILLTHEAPSPYVRGTQDIGQKEISDVSERLKPRIHVFGHHHKYGVYDYKGVKTVGLEYGWNHAVLWDEVTGDLQWKALPA